MTDSGLCNSIINSVSAYFINIYSYTGIRKPGQGFNIGWILLQISVIVVAGYIKYVTNEEEEECDIIFRIVIFFMKH